MDDFKIYRVIEKTGLCDEHISLVLPYVFNELVNSSFEKYDRGLYPEPNDAQMIYESLCAAALKFLGFDDMKQLGYTKEPMPSKYPSGVLDFHDGGYTVIYNARVGERGYSITNADVRIMNDCAKTLAAGSGKKKGGGGAKKRIYYLFLSGKFNDEGGREPEGADNPCLLMTSHTLLHLLMLKLRNPDALNPRSLEILLYAGKTPGTPEVKAFAKKHGIDYVNVMEIINQDKELNIL